MRVRRGALALALGLVMVAGLPGPVAASHHGNAGIGSFLRCDEPLTPPRCTSVGDDSVHRVYVRPSVPAGIARAVRRSLRGDYDPTHLRIRIQARITRRTDVIVSAADYGANGAAGWVWCPPDAPQGRNAEGDRWCRQQRLHFNLNPIYAAYLGDRGSRAYMACHELGHTIGLHHWGTASDPPLGSTCMQPDVPNGPTHLHRWDVEDINRYYRRPGATVASPQAAGGTFWFRRNTLAGSNCALILARRS